MKTHKTATAFLLLLRLKGATRAEKINNTTLGLCVSGVSGDALLEYISIAVSIGQHLNKP